MERYVDVCIADIRRQYEEIQYPEANSVFFGGGTPSLLPPELLTRILDAIPFQQDTEITVECNPETVNESMFRVYVDHGVNRISLGMQSAVPHVLQTLGRRHNPETVEQAVHMARGANISQINLDLIYGSDGESVQDWEESVRSAIDLAPDHVSAYALTIEPGTPLAKLIQQGTRGAPDDDDQALKYQMTDALLSDAGYTWYEISNWARSQSECKHNLLYWQQQEYLAIGCAAHAYRNGTRWWNVRTPERCIDLIERNESVIAGSETLDLKRSLAERITLALRTRMGVPMDLFPVSDAVADIVKEFEEAELAKVISGSDPRPSLVLTVRGRLLANELTIRLLTACEVDGNTSTGAQTGTQTPFAVSTING